jgi:hypothetical protein
MSVYCYITSRPFTCGVGRDHFLPLASILKHTFRLFYFHLMPHKRSPFSGTFDLAFFLNLPNLGQETFERENLIYLFNY